MTDERVDLSALDPDADGGAEARFVDRVMGRLAGRPAPAVHLDPLVGVWSMTRSPALAAGILIVAAIGAMGLSRLRNASTAPTTIAQAIGVPAEFLASAETGR